LTKILQNSSAVVEKRTGTQNEAANECRKSKNAIGWIYEWGQQISQGTRTDLKALLKESLEKTTKQLIEEYPEVYHKYKTTIREYKDIITEEKETEKLKK
jgi:hypothetical protein